MKKSNTAFSFLSITPLPGLSLIKQESAVLLALSLCEAISLSFDSPHTLLILYVLLQVTIASCASLYALHVCQHSGDHNVSRLQGVVRFSLGTKLLTMCLAGALAAHKLFVSRELVCVTLDEVQECSEAQPWWQVSTAALCFEATFATLSCVALLLLLRHIAKAALELRYRSLAFYLEL
jgi:hypothetical protein